MLKWLSPLALSIFTKLYQVLRKRLEKGLVPQVPLIEASYPALENRRERYEGQLPFPVPLHAPEEMIFFPVTELIRKISQRM